MSGNYSVEDRPLNIFLKSGAMVAFAGFGSNEEIPLVGVTVGNVGYPEEFSAYYGFPGMCLVDFEVHNALFKRLLDMITESKELSKGLRLTVLSCPRTRLRTIQIEIPRVADRPDLLDKVGRCFEMAIEDVIKSYSARL